MSNRDKLEPSPAGGRDVDRSSDYRSICSKYLPPRNHRTSDSYREPAVRNPNQLNPSYTKNEKQLSSDKAVQVPSNSEKAVQVPSDSVHQPRSYNVDEQPIDNVDQLTSQNVVQQPSDNVDQQPSDNVDQQPSDNVDQQPSDNVDKLPSKNVDQPTSRNVDQQPSDNVNKLPRENEDQQPSDNVDKLPRKNVDQQPSDSLDKQPRENMNQQPSDNVDKPPSKNMDQQPSDNVDKLPGESVKQSNLRQKPTMPPESVASAPGNLPAALSSGQSIAPKPDSKRKSDGLNEDALKDSEATRKKVQMVNCEIRDLRCQDIFSRQIKKESPSVDMLAMMNSTNQEFLLNFDNMWGATQDFLESLQLNRVGSSDLSFVPSSCTGMLSNVKRSESFEKLNSKALPRVIVCGSGNSECVPRIIVCEDKNKCIPPGNCNIVESRNTRMKANRYS